MSGDEWRIAYPCPFPYCDHVDVLPGIHRWRELMALQNQHYETVHAAVCGTEALGRIERLEARIVALDGKYLAARQENERLREKNDRQVVFDQNNAYYAEIEQLRADLAAAVAALTETNAAKYAEAMREAPIWFHDFEEVDARSFLALVRAAAASSTTPTETE